MDEQGTATAPAQEAARVEKPYDRNREGARWINRRPTGAEFAAWFHDNVRLDERLDPAKYVGGVVLIPAVEKAQQVTGWKNNRPMIEKVEQLTYTPYPKVETRLEYWWDLLEARRDEWVGEIEPVETRRPAVEPVEVVEQILDGDRMIDRTSRRVPQIVQTVEQLPAGFFVMTVPVGAELAHYLCATWRVTIRRREDRNEIVRSGTGTKMVPLVISRTWDGKTTLRPDENSIMKAETGAKGRALGFAGILNIPGSGVATAEDMIDALTAPAAASAPESDAAGPAAPEQEPAPQRSRQEQARGEHDQLAGRMRELLAQVEDLPGALEAFREWAKRRQPPVTNVNQLRGPALRGAVKKLEGIVADALAKAESEAETKAEPEPQPEPLAEAEAES